jgi:hypothetical protein
MCADPGPAPSEKIAGHRLKNVTAGAWLASAPDGRRVFAFSWRRDPETGLDIFQRCANSLIATSLAFHRETALDLTDTADVPNDRFWFENIPRVKYHAVLMNEYIAYSLDESSSCSFRLEIPFAPRVSQILALYPALRAIKRRIPEPGERTREATRA